MSFRFSSCASAVALAILLLPACTQVRGRKRIREANELYHRGKYAEAVTLYKEAEALVPELPVALAERGLHLPAADRARQSRSRRAAAPPPARSPPSAGSARWRPRIRAPAS